MEEHTWNSSDEIEDQDLPGKQMKECEQHGWYIGYHCPFHR